jgi:hypothetical protein
LVLQYDVELYQRIEHLIGKQLPLYKTEEEEVMVLQERVSEAQRVAKMVRLHWNISPIYKCNVFIIFHNCLSICPVPFIRHFQINLCSKNDMPVEGLDLVARKGQKCLRK